MSSRSVTTINDTKYSPLIILTARRIIKPNSNSNKIKIPSIDARGDVQRRELKVRRSERKKERRKRKGKEREKNKINACIPCPRNTRSRAKTDQWRASFHSASRDQYLLDKPVHRSDRSLKLYARYIQEEGLETREGTDYVSNCRL